MPNHVRRIDASNRYIDTWVVDQPRDYAVEGRAIVINPTHARAWIGEEPMRPLPAFSSTILVDTVYVEGEQALLLRYRDSIKPREIEEDPGWDHLNNLMPGFPRDTPLYRGPRNRIGRLSFDPATVLAEERPVGLKSFDVWINLWYAPAGTDCLIHNVHDFIEIHSQVFGYGSMQKFRSTDPSTLYEEQEMSPGTTFSTPFCRTRPGGGFVYPWHQYRAESECIWLAVEYHAPDFKNGVAS
jgi:hypothetical protein